MIVEVPIEHHTLWVVVIQSKIRHDSNCWDAVDLPSASHQSLWKGISQILPVFLPLTKLSLGSGNKICFWLDPCTGPLPLSSSLPRLHRLSSLPKNIVSGFLSSDSS